MAATGQLKPNQFLLEVAGMPGGERITACIQCGTCSGSCPTSYRMDYTPRKLLTMVRAGLKERVLQSEAIWLCASCYSCSVRCPRGVVITDLMYALKNLAIQQGFVPKKAVAYNFYSSFNRVVEDVGRLNERRLITRFALKTDPAKLIKFAPLGLKLLVRGRLAVFPPSLKNKKEFKRMIARGKGGGGK